MYVLPKCHKKSPMIKSNPSCSVRNACRVHFRHRPINSFTFSKSNTFKTLNWSWKFFLVLCQFFFSHPPKKSFHIKLCYTCLIEIQYYVQLQFVFLQVFLLPIASITCSAMLLLYPYQLHSIKQAWMYIMPWPIKLYLGHTWFHWPTFQYVFPNYLWEKDFEMSKLSPL